MFAQVAPARGQLAVASCGEAGQREEPPRLGNKWNNVMRPGDVSRN